MFLITFFTWAALAKISESTVGDGRVIPSGQVQVVQNLEGGIVSDIKACQSNFSIAADVPTCAGARDGTCLTSAQKTVLTKIFAGAKKSNGESTYSNFYYDPGVAGSNYAYSGEGISLLQFGIEKGLGLSVEAELQRRFFQPLGMTRTSLIWQDSFGTNLADGWDENGETEPHDDRSRVRAAVRTFSSSNAWMSSMLSEMVPPGLAT